MATGSVRTDIVPNGNDVRPATAADLGLTRKEIHEARIIRDAEKADPGIVRRTLHEALSQPVRSIRQRPHDSLDALEGNKTLGVTVRYVDALAMV